MALRTSRSVHPVLPPASRRVGFGACRNGASAVEFALVAPLLIGLVCVMIYAALYFGLAHSVQEIAADASRYAMVGSDAGERAALVARWQRAHTATYALVQPERLATDVREDDDVLVVTASYDASYLPSVPFIGGVLALPTTIRRTAAQVVPR